MLPSTLLVATTNKGKLAEFNQLLNPIHCIAEQSEGKQAVDEIGLTFIENALIKARAASMNSQYMALADDSGLVVPALNGEPGIKSARFALLNDAGTDNLTYLIQRIKSIDHNRRGAYFYCALAVMSHPYDPTPIIATGTLHGVILDTPRGQQGFGYDPIFYLPELNCTLAELTLSEKNSLSHRAKATQILLTLLTGDKA